MKHVQAYQLIKKSGIYLWQHPFIIVALAILGMFSVSLCACIGFAYMLFALPRIAIHNIYAFSWFFLWAICLILFHCRISSAAYMLGVVRSERITIPHALWRGLLLMKRAWRIVLFYLGCIVTTLTAELFLHYRHPHDGQVLMAVGFAFLVSLMGSGYFIEQLICDGKTTPHSLWKTSCRLVRENIHTIMLVTAFLAAITLPFIWFDNLFILGCVVMLTVSWHSVTVHKFYQSVITK
jgi:hypothetical protein